MLVSKGHAEVFFGSSRSSPLSQNNPYRAFARCHHKLPFAPRLSLLPTQLSTLADRRKSRRYRLAPVVALRAHLSVPVKLLEPRSRPWAVSGRRREQAVSPCRWSLVSDRSAKHISMRTYHPSSSSFSSPVHSSSSSSSSFCPVFLVIRQLTVSPNHRETARVSKFVLSYEIAAREWEKAL